jgi:Leucine-rich repeat (LRR) protein
MKIAISLFAVLLYTGCVNTSTEPKPKEEVVREAKSVQEVTWHEAIVAWSKKYEDFGFKLPKTKEELEKLKKISYFGWKRKPIEEIPVEIGYLTSLETLSLNFNNISEIPAEIGNLSNLKVLDLSDNYISEIPEELGNLSNLENLNLSSEMIENGNPITSLPDSLNRLENLKESGEKTRKNGETPIEFLDRVLELEPADWHEAIVAWSKKYEDFGFKLPKTKEELEKLKKISYFGWKRKPIEEIPAEIGYLTSLETLDLPLNEISEIPAEIGNLSNLKVLDLSYNYISEIPEELGNLSNLEKLDLSSNPEMIENGNPITSLPDSLNRLENLKESGEKTRKNGETPLQFLKRVLGI